MSRYRNDLPLERLIGATVTEIRELDGELALIFGADSYNQFGNALVLNDATVKMARAAIEERRRSAEADERATLARLKAKYESSGIIK